ncbi:hypothetical protein HDV02_001505 [Globomyces sp. JEL0801]|nr:hypothetical protein HDV02_001505 [Globomyces sp. JEL0801]
MSDFISRMGPSPFAFAHSHSDSKKKFFAHLREHTPPDVLPTAGFAKLQGACFFVIQSLAISVGSDPECDVVVNVAGVDRVHFTIHYELESNSFCLSVLGRTGLYINDEFCPYSPAVPIVLSHK